MLFVPTLRIIVRNHRSFQRFVSWKPSRLPEHEQRTTASEIFNEKERKNSLSIDLVNVQTGEINGPKSLEPTRYGDWENSGRCWDF